MGISQISEVQHFFPKLPKVRYQTTATWVSSGWSLGIKMEVNKSLTKISEADVSLATGRCCKRYQRRSMVSPMRSTAAWNLSKTIPLTAPDVHEK